MPKTEFWQSFQVSAFTATGLTVGVLSEFINPGLGWVTPAVWFGILVTVAIGRSIYVSGRKSKKPQVEEPEEPKTELEALLDNINEQPSAGYVVSTSYDQKPYAIQYRLMSGTALETWVDWTTYGLFATPEAAEAVMRKLPQSLGPYRVVDKRNEW